MHRILLALLLVTSSVVHADTKLSIVGSLLYNTPDTKDIDDAGVQKEESELGLGIGLRALVGLSDQLYLRSGAGLVQKKFSFEIDDPDLGVEGDLEASITYLNIPLTLYWKASPQVGLFGGSALNAKLSDDCEASGDFEDCTLKDPESLVLPLILGFDFSFADRFGIEASYEYALMDAVEDTKVSSAVVSFLYHLD